MAATYKELKRRVALGMPRIDGEVMLVIEQAVNDAIQAFAKLEDFDEMLVKDTATANTVDGQKSYSLIATDWVLTRYKDILTIVLEDEGNSRKLVFKDYRTFDIEYPYPEQFSETRPSFYIPRGTSIELFPIPDAAYDVTIFYSQYPAELTTESGVNPFSNFDMEIVFLAKEITNAYINNNYIDTAQRARSIIQGGLQERKYKPDKDFIARPFQPLGEPVRDEYWLNPLIRKV